MASTDDESMGENDEIVELDEIDEIDEMDDMEIDLLLLMLLERLSWYRATYLNKLPVHDQTYRGNQVVHDMIHGHWRVCFDMCRMMPPVFMRLCQVLSEKGLVQSSRNVSVEEQLWIFLQTIGHNDRNRFMQDTLKHSGETISSCFNKVLNAICIWAPEIIRPKEPLENIPKYILKHDGGKYYPFFKDCVGAIDGTHVHATVPANRQMAYRSGRSKITTQNVMGVCDFNMHFTFISAGWEGSAHDAKVLRHAAYNPIHNFPMPPGDKYYVVDAVYPNRKGFLAPYRKVRRVAPRGPEELFNSLHSSLRNIIERSFGVLKKRWPILQQMPNYSYKTQVKIVIAAIAIHNFIIEQQISDEVLQFSQDTVNGQQSTNDEEDSSLGKENTNDITMSMSAVRDSIRDQIAVAHGLNR